jgi:hypothetical protein
MPGVRLVVIAIAVVLAGAGCEKPRDRACRALLIQAHNAEAARTAGTPDPRYAVYRAQSAARWLRSNVAEDPELAAHARTLADALDRLADARLRLASASEILGTTDPFDLLARAQRVSEYVATSDRVVQIGLKPCPWNTGDSLIEDPRCTPYDSRETCPPFDTERTLAAHAAQCLHVAETLPDLARVRSDAVAIVEAMRAHAAWIATLPVRSAKETVDLARSIEHIFEDRGRADADIAAGIKAVESKCAQ